MEAFENGCFEPIPALEKAEKAREKGKRCLFSWSYKKAWKNEFQGEHVLRTIIAKFQGMFFYPVFVSHVQKLVKSKIKKKTYCKLGDINGSFYE